MQRYSHWYIGLLAAVAGVLPSQGAQPATRPALDDLIRRGESSSRLLQSEQASASWDAELAFDAVKIHVSRLVKAGQRRIEATVDGEDGKPESLFTVVIRDGAWHVWDLGKPKGKYRPYEAPLSMPNAYLMVEMSEPVFACDIDLENAVVESATATKASLRIPPSAEERAAYQSVLGNLTKLERETPDLIEPEMRRQAELMRDKAENGSIRTVDAVSGLVLEVDCGRFRKIVTRLDLNAEIADRYFDVGQAAWADFTSDPTKGVDLNDLVMIGNAPMGRPEKKMDPDLLLVNIKTRQMRRVPFNGFGCLSGCFSKDRKSVYVSGIDPSGSGLLLFEIDLSSGENRSLSEDASGSMGLEMMPSLSPDGRQLAVLRKGLASPLEFQVCLVDIETGIWKKIGKPMDTAFLSWLDDGSGLILVSRKHIAMDKPSEESIARMDLTGAATVLTPGSHPVLIPGQRRILYEDRADGEKWKTCDLEGKDSRVFADGMKKYGFPAVSPDGRRLIWMKFDAPRGPAPFVQDYPAGQPRALDLGPGLWMSPAWK